MLRIEYIKTFTRHFVQHFSCLKPVSASCGIHTAKVVKNTGSEILLQCPEQHPGKICTEEKKPGKQAIKTN
ncbi:hypothetical protein JCM6294_2737 [Bacteroides pyogenes DSM 20611 = JCM 6294]|uniref:Uncharacterized protein n=1 Tax=Bacteroides pyogenes DSM 20611 = JCM 6294 TaxID=1121100 RepID=W4PIK5_9BACE|nr:hypothetical protein JCM6294_2737 [Bacteroides pyogenes DSM 20611 = JCM 6294]